MTTITFDYDEKAAAAADNVASRIDQSAAYIGQCTDVHAITSSKGTGGLHFEFKSPGGGNASFDLYTKKEDGSVVSVGMNKVQAMMTILGLRGLASVSGEFEAYNNDSGKREKTQGETFPQLMNKDIGFVLQKEHYTKNDGKDGFRMNLYAIFHPVTRLTASEIKEHKAAPEKLEKILRSLKDQDSRVAKVEEPAQPPMGATGGF